MYVCVYTVIFLKSIMVNKIIDTKTRYHESRRLEGKNLNCTRYSFQTVKCPREHSF